jgi:hypothetical protein
MSPIVLKALWIYGLAAVVALLIAAVIKLIVLVLGRLDRAPAARPALPVAAPAARPGVPAAHVAAIAAAVQATLGAHRVVHIEERRGGGLWSAEGRSSQHHSHAGRDRRRSH